MVRNPIVGIRFPTDELEVLDALAAYEERSRSDVVRRAVRAYAEKLGIKTGSKAKRKKK
jgi:metal-responsive CopG/Arc/MetJ family transcriptional regulator